MSDARTDQSRELLPCPFCGEQPTIKSEGKVSFIICPEGSSCIGSGLAIGFESDNERGIEAWNRRATTEQSSGVELPEPVAHINQNGVIHEAGYDWRRDNYLSGLYTEQQVRALLAAAHRGGRTAPNQPQARMDAQSDVVVGVLPEIIEKALDWIENDTRECVRDHIAKNYDPNEIYTSLDQLKRILRAAPEVPQGWKLVPVEPTQEMLDHVNRTVPDLFELGDEYRAMLAAAPQPPKEQT